MVKNDVIKMVADFGTMKINFLINEQLTAYGSLNIIGNAARFTIFNYYQDNVIEYIPPL